ncbi:MAG: flagellar hook assembly protein FlgD [bacterium]|jgi:flagellar basal-body rod modification protein FlgD
MVSAVNQTTSPGTSATQLSSAINNDVSRDDFLRLLVAQLQHQDPLNPVENQEFVAELATFSSLEQQTAQTQLLQQLIDSQNSGYVSQAISLIGKDVSVATDRFIFTPEEEIQFDFQASQAGNQLVQITTDSGQVVMTDVAVAAAPGQATYTFDGILPDGSQLPSGIYNIKIGGSLEDSGRDNALPVFMRGDVEGVNFKDGVPILVVNGQPVEMAQVGAVFQKKG